MTLPNSVTTIGDYSFSLCENLVSIALPGNLTSIGVHAFYFCSALTGISIPNSVTQIGDDAFWGCGALSSVTIPDLFLASIANIGLDFNPGTASKVLNEGIARGLQNNNSFVSSIAAKVLAEQGTAPKITSSLSSQNLRRAATMTYTTTTNFNANAFAAVGLPTGLVIHPVTGVISGKPTKAGTYSTFIYAGVPGGLTTNSVKVFVVQ